MRKQYHFRQSPRGLLAWDVHRLIDLSSELPVVEIPLEEIRELDTCYWYDLPGDMPTCRSVALHAVLMAECDLSHPVILSSTRGVMDGMHRICRAFMENRSTIKAVIFPEDPTPDYIGVPPDKLPYDDREGKP